MEIPNDSEALMLKLKAKYYRREIVSTGLVRDRTCLCVSVEGNNYNDDWSGHPGVGDAKAIAIFFHACDPPCRTPALM